MLEPAVGLPSPQALLDAGDAHGAILTDAIARRMADLPSGQILHLVAQSAEARADIPAWCATSGCSVAAMSERGKEILFWIQKH